MNRKTTYATGGKHAFMGVHSRDHHDQSGRKRVYSNRVNNVACCTGKRPLYTCPILSEHERLRSEGESKDPEDVSSATPTQGVSTRMGVLSFPAMREGRFYKFWVYIIASRTGTLYTGMTGFVDTRIFQHKSGEIDGFTKKYKCDRLVYYEQYDDVYVAKRRELQLKGWRREKKIALIEKMNPRWEDLAENWGREMLFRGQSMKKKV